MFDQQSLSQLQKSWPETTDYLERVGQVTNDLSVLREMLQRDGYEMKLDWLDQLAVDVEDLTKTPTAVAVMMFLHRRGISIRSAAQIEDYQELREEQEQDYSEGYGSSAEILDDPTFVLPSLLDARLWALPELQKKLIAWATETSARHGEPNGQPTLTQAAILMRVTQFLEQEPEQSPEWAAECLRSALSSEFYSKAGSPQS